MVFCAAALGGEVGAHSAVDPPEAQAGLPTPPRYTPYVDRGMSLPAPYISGTLGSTSAWKRDAATTIESNLGAGIGLTSRIWIEGSVGTAKLAPKLGYHSPQIGIAALLVDTPVFELDVTTHVTFAAEDGRPVEQIEPGFFSVLHVAHKLRIDNGAYLDINPGPRLKLGMRLPVSAGFQISEHVHAIVNTGLTIDDFDDMKKTAAIPAGLTLGWSDRVGSGAKAPSVGVIPSVTFKELIKPGEERVFRPENVTVGITFVYVSQL